MKTAVTFATSDVDKLNSIKEFIRSLNTLSNKNSILIQL